MPRSKNPFLHGTLELLVLKTLTHGGRHGYGIAREIEDVTEGEIPVEEGSLYPALGRLEKRGWVRSEWGLSEKGRQARFYRLTPRGHEHLEGESERWRRFSKVVTRLLDA